MNSDYALSGDVSSSIGNQATLYNQVVPTSAGAKAHHEDGEEQGNYENTQGVQQDCQEGILA